MLLDDTFGYKFTLVQPDWAEKGAQATHPPGQYWPDLMVTNANALGLFRPVAAPDSTGVGAVSPLVAAGYS